MPVLTFPDGNTREVAAGTTGRSVVEGIAKSLAKRTVAMALDGTVCDLTTRSLRTPGSSFSTVPTRALSN